MKKDNLRGVATAAGHVGGPEKIETDIVFNLLTRSPLSSEFKGILVGQTAVLVNIMMNVRDDLFESKYSHYDIQPYLLSLPLPQASSR